MALTTEKEASTRSTSVSTQRQMEEDHVGNSSDGDNNMETIALDAGGGMEGHPSTHITSTASTSTIEEQMDEQTKKSFYTKLVVGLVFVVFVVFIIVDSITSMHALDAIHEFLDWVEENPGKGVFAFVFVYFAATLVFIPGALLTLGSGFVFGMPFGIGAGVALGTLVVFVGASAAAVVSFLLGRYLLRQQMQKFTKKYAILEALEAALEKNGLRIFILLRLSPIVPFGVLNYVAGVTSVVFRDYCLALVAILPGTIFYVFLGASAASLSESAMSGNNATITIVVSVVGAVFGFLAIFVTTRFARKELNRVLEERRQANDNDQEQEQEVAMEETKREDVPSNHTETEESGTMNVNTVTPTPVLSRNLQEFDA